jgi:hypothetical protein
MKANNYSDITNTQGDDSSLDPPSRGQPMRMSSFNGQNEDSGAYQYGGRRVKKDDKIPFSPDVSNERIY